jgi:AhpD family alkylhydroperoxidase
MKKVFFTIIFAVVCSTAYSQDGILTNEEKQELLAASPFNSVYPESILKSADTYFKASMALYQEGAIAEKEAHLVALGTSAATKCQYCIPYHISELKRLGATENEIKTAVLIAADIMKMSTMFYGNEFDLLSFKKMLSGQ